MGPTGTPTEIPEAARRSSLAGGGLGNAVLFSIGKALRARGNRVLYFAAYRKREDIYKIDEIEAAADQIVWSVDGGELPEARRPAGPRVPRQRRRGDARLRARRAGRGAGAARRLRRASSPSAATA